MRLVYNAHGPARIFEPERQCNHCGSFYGVSRDRNGRATCGATDCMLCGAVVCMSSGLGSGLCPVCHIGYLSGWSHGRRDRCERARCGKEAVAIVRKRAVCKEHAGTVVPDLERFRVCDDGDPRPAFPTEVK